MSHIFSHHHFLFPFKWDTLPKGFDVSQIKERLPFDNRVNIDIFEEKIGNWDRKPLLLKKKDGAIDFEMYNEFIYFHEYVQKAIFDYEYPWKNNQNVVKYYEYPINKLLENKYEIQTKKDGVLELIVDGITVHFFNSGVGIMSFNLSNHKTTQSSKESILKLNEYGRRLYPQFLTQDGIASVQDAFLAEEIRLYLNGTIFCKDDFRFPLEVNDFKPYEAYSLPNFIKNLFPENFIFKVTQSPLLENKTLITKVTDDRMFFLSWYGENNKSKEIADYHISNKEINDEWFYAYLFGDKGEGFSHANPLMMKKSLHDNTYQRWIDARTLYGITNDSFVCLTDESSFAYDHIRKHMQTVYYAIIVLCLCQRSSILKFTAEVASLADLAKINKDDKLIANIKEIYKNYIEFTNKLYFREVTSQIQGKEIYELIQKVMNIDREIKDLDNEVNELNQYVTLVQGEKRNEEAALLNKIAIAFLPATLIFGILGSNFLESNNFFYNQGIDIRLLKWIGFGLSPIPFAALYFVYKYFHNKFKA